MRFGLVVVLVAALVATAASAATSRARVQMTSTAPVSVRGTSFYARERVTVTVSASSARTKVVTANARGAFRATFLHFAIGRCVPYFVQAKGNKGSFATLRVAPDCPPPAKPRAA
jgi:hypothetical protein